VVAGVGELLIGEDASRRSEESEGCEGEELHCRGGGVRRYVVCGLI
jgi:hypothetical protein